MSNLKISLSAEFVSIIKKKYDPKYNYFISKKTKIIYSIIVFIFPKKSLNNIFEKRLLLSKEFDIEIETKKPKTIIEIGSGYSLRGFNLCLKNPKLKYIDTDFNEVIENKIKILEIMCKNENIDFPKNYLLIPCDILNEDLENILKNNLSENKTLIIAEGLSSYFTKSEFELFFNNILSFLQKYKKSSFFSHEQYNTKKTSIYKILRFILTLLTRNKSHLKFNTKIELEGYLNSKKNIKIEKIMQKNSQLYYSIKN